MSDRILIAGYIGFGNAGDEAIAQVVAGHIRQQVPAADITMISGNPAQTAEAYGVRAIYWKDPLAITEAVRNTDLTILGGGGLFQDYWGFDPNAVLTREQWGLSFYLAPALLSAIYDKPLMLYAMGAGPLLSAHGRQFTKVAGDIATRITVRDFHSKDLFESLGVSASKITVTADPGFDLPPSADAGEIPEVREWASRKPAIAVCLRNWGFGTDQTFCERQIAAALDGVVESEGGHLLFLPFHVDPASNDDVAAAKRAVALMRNRQNTTILTQAYPAPVLAGILAQADLVLGMRLHSVIFSLSASVPFVAIEYDPKIAAMTALTGLEEFTIPLGGIEADMLAGRMRKALHGREEFREFSGRLVEDLRDRARQNAVIAAELLHEGSYAADHGYDYGPDTRALIGRLILSQVATAESHVERLRTCCKEFDIPVTVEMRPTELADALVQKAKDLRILKEERDQLWTQLDGAWKALAESRRQLEDGAAILKRTEEESRRTSQELEDTRLEAAATQKRLESEILGSAHELEIARAQARHADAQLAQVTGAAKALEARLAPLESKTLGSIAKRGLQVSLDMLQILTPGPLRGAIRKHYLNWFYFRIYPERRVRAAASPYREPNSQ